MRLTQVERCRLLNVMDRGYRAWRSRPVSRRQRDDRVILAHIREQHRLSLGSYGRPRMTEERKERGLDVGHRRVGRLMKENNISVIRTRKYKITTDSAHNLNIAPIFWTGIFISIAPIKNGLAIYPLSGRVRAGFIWL
jgi:hypothetical protein